LFFSFSKSERHALSGKLVEAFEAGICEHILLRAHMLFGTSTACLLHPQAHIMPHARTHTPNATFALSSAVWAIQTSTTKKKYAARSSQYDNAESK
jgi:hypothetical protein